MQTRRDQLQAYRFQNRRALAALITGEPNIVDPPMRRLTITTISGIMIAVLVTVGFTVFGLIRPKAGDSWKEAGSIIVDVDTGSNYVYLDGTLYSIVNYTSGVLALGASQRAKIVKVDSSDLAGVPRGPQIGVTGLPGTLPDAGDLVTAPIAACSRQQVVATNQVGVRVTVDLGSADGARQLPAAQAVLVNTGTGSQSYLLFDGHRLAVSAGRVATSLGYADEQPLRVGRAFLDTIPQGPALATPTLPGAGSPAGVKGVTALVGQLVRTSSGRYFVAMPDGVAPVNPVQRALLQTLPIGPGGSLIDPVSASESTVLSQPSSQWAQIVSSRLSGLPTTVPPVATEPGANGGVCALFRGGSDEPRLAVPASKLPSFRVTSITETAVSQRGGADKVTLPPGRAALLGPIGTSPTVYLVGDSGRKFAASSNEILAGFGYSSDDVTKLPAALLALIPSGPALSRTEALRPVGN